MATITVMVGEAPYSKERLYTSLRFVLAALSQGHKVNLFLFEDAIFAAKAGQLPPEIPGLLDGRMPNCQEMLAAAIRQGAVVQACGVCATERGLSQKEMVDGVNIGSMIGFVDWVVNSDKVVPF